MINLFDNSPRAAWTLVGCLLLLLAGGLLCLKRIAVPSTIIQPVSTQEVENATDETWFYCDESEADRVLVLDLSIKGCFDSHRTIIPQKRAAPEVFEIAFPCDECGAEVGSSWSGSIFPVRANQSGATVKVSYGWRIIDHIHQSFEDRKIDQEVVVPLAGIVNKQIADGVVLSASFHKPSPSTSTQPSSLPASQTARDAGTSHANP